jgi:hypothetical protein
VSETPNLLTGLIAQSIPDRAVILRGSFSGTNVSAPVTPVLLEMQFLPKDQAIPTG